MQPGIPFKYATKPKSYEPLGLPKVKGIKQPKVEVKPIRFPNKPRVTILDRRIINL